MAQKSAGVVRALWVLTVVVAVCAAVNLIYGFVEYPDAPIRQAGEAYAGKGGQPHTREEYLGFRAWETRLMVTFAATFALGFATSGLERWLARRSRSAE